MEANLSKKCINDINDIYTSVNRNILKSQILDKIRKNYLLIVLYFRSLFFKGVQ